MPNSRHNAAMQLPALLASMTNRIRSSDICTRFHGIPFTLLLAFLPHKKCQGCPVTKCQGCHETEHFSLPGERGSPAARIAHLMYPPKWDTRVRFHGVTLV